MDKYREFDVASTGDQSTVSFSRFQLSKRELILGVTAIVCILVVIILAALLGAANSKGSDQEPSHAAQTGNNKTTGDGSGGSSSNACNKNTSCLTPACFRAASHALDLMNETAKVDPCEDFYTYACGGFPQLHPLNQDESEVTTFSLIYDLNQNRVRQMVESVSPREDPTHYQSKLSYLYTSCVDHLERAGLKGTPFLEKVVKPSGGWWVLTGDSAWPPAGYSFQRQLEMVHVDFWTDVFFTFSVGIDWLDWNNASISIFLGGLGLPYRAYEDPADVAAYEQYVRTVGSLLIRDANLELTDRESDHRLDTFVQDVLFVETELATVINSSKFEENPHALDRRPTLGELSRNFTGEVDWVSLFSRMFNNDTTPLTSADTRVVVYEQEYLQKFYVWMKNLNPANKTRFLNNYMIWRLADSYSRFLDWDYAHAYYMLQKNQTGSVQMPPAWKSCLSMLDGAMRDAMGALFVKDHFSESSSQHAHQITDYVRQALVDSLSGKLHWMSPETRHLAIMKLNSSLIKLGYPDLMKNDDTLNSMYSSLTINHKDYFGNILSMHAMTRRNWVHYFRYPKDRSEWVYATYSTQAEYYNPWQELIIPAGAMQFPIFDYKGPRYANFGSMGSMVGSQLTHAVDAIGNDYLLNGSHYGEWWSANTTQTYYRQVRQCMINAYDQYLMGPILDLGRFRVPSIYIPYALSESTGVKLAYKAYQLWMQQNKKEPMMPTCKFTNEQMFFVSYAQSHCANRNPIDEAFYILWFGDHVTDKVKVNGALAQLQEFQDAFKCSKDSNMVAQTRCNLY